MPNDTIITISRRVIPINLEIDSLPRLAIKHIEIKSELCKLRPVESLPELVFVYDSLEGVMPVEAEVLLASVEVVAYPMDKTIENSLPDLMAFITLATFFIHWRKIIYIIKELKGCFL